MAKAVVWGGMLVVVFGGILFFMQAMNADSGQTVGYAISAPDSNNVCELQVVVTTMMNAADGPSQTVSPTSMTPDWSHWAANHLIVIDDATGQQIDFRKGAFKSQDITEQQFGAAETIMIAELEAGKTYTMHYVPDDSMPEKYVKTLTGAAKEFRRETFDPDY